MIIWLASYPRSGNMLLRMMLNKVFGCRTYTKYYKYNPAPPPPSEATIAIPNATGVAPLAGTWRDAYPGMSTCDEVCLVKTHDLPEDNAKAVYLARNGFAAVISYQYFLRDLKQEHHSLENIILGKVKFGSWGYHLDVWQPFERPNTLLLRYEDLMRKPEEQIEKLAHFCALRPEKTWTNEFERFHALHPALFRKAEMGDASAEFSKAERDLFWSLHGDWMQQLGYATGGFDASKALPKLRGALIEQPQPMLKADSRKKRSSVRQTISMILRKARMSL